MENAGIVTVNTKEGAKWGWFIQFPGEAPLFFTQSIGLSAGLWPSKEFELAEGYEVEARLYYLLIRDYALARLAGSALSRRDLVQKIRLSAMCRRLLARERQYLSDGVRPEGHPRIGAIIEEVVAALEARGYVDDAAYAEEWIAAQERRRPKGKLMLRSQLRQKAIDREIVDRLLEDYDEEGACRAAAEAFLRKGKRGQALIRSLASRGFSAAVVYRIAPRLECEYESEGE